MEEIEKLKNSLKSGVVVFEYKKKDGSVRTAKGTLNENHLPENEPEEFELEKSGVDSLISKNYVDLEEYMEKNRLELIGMSEDGNNYQFRHKKREVKKNEDLLTYFDLEKEEFRSFKKENFIRIVETAE